MRKQFYDVYVSKSNNELFAYTLKKLNFRKKKSKLRNKTVIAVSTNSQLIISKAHTTM